MFICSLQCNPDIQELTCEETIFLISTCPIHVSRNQNFHLLWKNNPSCRDKFLSYLDTHWFTWKHMRKQISSVNMCACIGYCVHNQRLQSLVALYLGLSSACECPEAEKAITYTCNSILNQHTQRQMVSWRIHLPHWCENSYTSKSNGHIAIADTPQSL